MTDHRPSAEIIPFPRRHFPDDPRIRLTRALAGLEAALSAQRIAVADWRGALGDLQHSVAGLGASARTAHAAFGQVQTRLGALRGQAARLEAWAEQAVSQRLSPP